MKVNFDVIVTDYKGEPFMVTEGRERKPMNLSEKIQELMFFAGMDDPSMPAELKYRAYKVGRKLAGRKDNFTPEELSLIKDQANKRLVAGIAGQVVELIDGGSEQ